MLNPEAGSPAIPPGAESAKAIVHVRCTSCRHEYQIQANFRQPQPLDDNAVEFPVDDVLVCPKCGNKSNVAPLRRELENKAGASIVG